MEALQCMEKALILEGHCFGLESSEVIASCKSVAQMCNKIALSCLAEGQFDMSLELLKKAEVLSVRHKAVRAVTLNNFGCYYRKKGKLRTALSYVEDAVALEAGASDVALQADSHLNMCTILSELGRHDRAHSEARVALKYMLTELFGRPESVDGGEAKRLPKERVAVLAIAYHNLAVQEEYLGRFQECLSTYEKAVKVIKTHLGEDSPLVADLARSLENARAQVQLREEKQQKILRGSANRAAPPPKKPS